jgi:hypothetical protein
MVCYAPLRIKSQSFLKIIRLVCPPWSHDCIVLVKPSEPETGEPPRPAPPSRRLRQVQVPGRVGASSLALCCITTPSASSCSRSSEYITFCFSLCGHPAGTNYITCPLCRLSRRVRTRLQVLALHQVFLHSTRPTPHSRTRGLHRRRPTRRGRGRRRSGGLARPTGTTT